MSRTGRHHIIQLKLTTDVSLHRGVNIDYHDLRICIYTTGKYFNRMIDLVI